MNAQTKFFNAPQAVDIIKSEFLGRRFFIKTQRGSGMKTIRDWDMELLDLYCLKYFGESFHKIDTNTARMIEKLYIQDALNLKGLIEHGKLVGFKFKF
jgi:hypothetical protein